MKILEGNPMFLFSSSFQSVLQTKGPAPYLPMPKVSAPSPSSSVEYDENEPSWGIALYDFEPIQDGDLGLRVSRRQLEL